MSTIPCAWAVNDRPVRVDVNVSSGVCSGSVQVIGLLVKVIVEHESAQLTLVSTKRAPNPKTRVRNLGSVGAMRTVVGREVDRIWGCSFAGPVRGRKPKRQARPWHRGYYREFNRISIGRSVYTTRFSLTLKTVWHPTKVRSSLAGVLSSARRSYQRDTEIVCAILDEDIVA